MSINFDKATSGIYCNERTGVKLAIRHVVCIQPLTARNMAYKGVELQSLYSLDELERLGYRVQPLDSIDCFEGTSPDIRAVATHRLSALQQEGVEAKLLSVAGGFRVVIRQHCNPGLCNEFYDAAWDCRCDRKGMFFLPQDKYNMLVAYNVYMDLPELPPIVLNPTECDELCARM